MADPIPPYCVPESEFCREESRTRVGTLTYTKLGLTGLMLVLFWGIFCYGMMEALIPSFLSPSLKSFGASNKMISILMVSIPALINLAVNPVVSFRSDRTRTRFGRRVPFLMIGVPLVSLALIGIGWTPVLAELLHRRFPELPTGYTGITLVAVFVVCFQFFNRFASSVFYYLFADVIPHKLLGRFMAGFTMICGISNTCFNRFVVPLADWNMPLIYTGVAVVYFISFSLVCLKTKEGKYPPPPPVEKKSPVAGAAVFFKECFSTPFFVWFFIGSALNEVSLVCRTAFNVLFAQNTLGMTFAEYGKAMSYGSLLTIVLCFPLGYLVDKLHPLRMFIAGIVLVVAVNLFGFFMIDSKEMFTIFTIMLAVVYTIQMASTLPLYAALLPRSRYGQFCAANSIVGSLFMMLTGGVGGMLIDWTGEYRYMYLWDAFFTSLALAAMLVVYRGWKRYGGPAHYLSPVE